MWYCVDCHHADDLLLCSAPLQSRLGAVPLQELIHLRSLYSAAICDQETLQHSQAIALRLCLQLTSQRCCPPETAEASMLPLPAHWLLLPLAGSVCIFPTCSPAGANC